MNDQFIDELLDDLHNESVPPANANARKIAINAAVSEFSQGTQAPARPIDIRDKQSIGSRIMKLLKSPQAGPIFATVAVAFVTVSLVTMMPQSLEEAKQQAGDQVLVTPDDSEIEKFDGSLDEIVVTAGKVEKQIGEPPVIAETESSAFKDEASPSKPGRSSKVAQKQANTLDEVVVSGSKVKNAPDTTAGVIETEPLAIESTALPQALQLDQSRMLNAKKVEMREAKRVESLRQNYAGAELSRAKAAFSSVPGEPSIAVPAPRPDLDEEYPAHTENSIKLVSQESVSTFSADVDTASYSLIRNQLQRGFLPAPNAVRTEEVINYFNYDYALPKSKDSPFKPSVNVFDSPWNQGKKLVHIGIKGYDIPKTKQADSNLVFLLDVSGSMSAQNKLPLVKQSIGLLLDTLKPNDTVSIAVYAGAAGTVLEPTKASEKSKIIGALRSLNAGGSTAGGEGIELAYQLAEQNFNKDAVNRIILATDGDFNVGQQSNEALKTLVERKRGKGVFLSVLGFGRNNYQDDMMQALAQNGNGVAAYIDSLSEAKKVLVDEATSTLFTIAQDVKLQVEFNAATVSEYRLVGYETRALNREDFNNDKVDAGDIGAGHTVTAIYEVTPVGSNAVSIDAPRYSANKKAINDANKNEYGFLKIRYKLPSQDTSKLIETAIPVSNTKATQDVLFSTAAAGFAQLLKGGKHTAQLSFDDVIKLAQANKGDDKFGYRSEFIQLVRMAKIARN